MKTLGCVVAIVLLCLAGTVRADHVPGNLITNGDFDTDLSGWGGAYGTEAWIGPGRAVSDPAGASPGFLVQHTEHSSNSTYTYLGGEELLIGADIGSLAGDVVSSFGAYVHLWEWTGASPPTSPGDLSGGQAPLMNGLITVSPAELNAGLASYTETFTVPAVHAGNTLSLVLTAPGGTVHWDNVFVTVIPEPSVLTLLATGLIGLLAYPWRRERRGRSFPT